MLFLRFSLVSFFLLCFLYSNSQLKVGNNPQTINPASMLEVESNSKGFLPPRLTTAQISAISNPPSGLIVYNTTVKCLQINVGTAASPDWQCLGVVAVPAAPVVNPSNGSVITGTGVPGAIIRIDTNGDGVADYTGTVTGGGTFSIAISPVLAHNSVAQVTQVVSGQSSAPVSVTIDSQAPAAPVLNPSNGTSITGTGEPNSTVLIDTNGDGTPDYTTTANSSGVFTQAISPALANGTVVSVRARDAAGNTSAPATVTVDAIAPAAPVLNPSNGTSISGTAEPNSTVLIDTNGDGTPDYTTTANGSGVFTQAISPALANGTVVTVRARDAAGNTSAPATVSIDSQAPAVPVLNPSTGTSISGTAEPNSTVLIDTNGDGTPDYTTTANGSGVFTQAISPTLANGTVVSVRTRDAAGNTSTAATLTVQSDPTSLPAGTGSFSGRTCFDIALSNDNANNCASLSSRTPQQANFTQVATHTQTYTFTPGGTVSNVRFFYNNTNGAVITAISGGNSGNNISTAVTATVNYNTSLNTLALGLTNSNPLTATITVVYNDGATNNGTDRQLTLTPNVKDCSCCGAFVASGQWRQFLCHNLGADQSADPLTPSWQLTGNYYQWGRNPVCFARDGVDGTNTCTSPVYGAAAPLGNTTSNDNAGAITGWSTTSASQTAWMDAAKTSNDPCPPGFKVPSKTQWDGVVNNTLNPQTIIGTFNSNATNYSSGIRFGPSLFLPANGNRSSSNGALGDRGLYGYYWSSTPHPTTPTTHAVNLGMVGTVGVSATSHNYSIHSWGYAVRCIAE